MFGPVDLCCFIRVDASAMPQGRVSCRRSGNWPGIRACTGDVSDVLFFFGGGLYFLLMCAMVNLYGMLGMVISFRRVLESDDG